MTALNLDEAAALLARAASSFLRCGDLLRAVEVLRDQADVSVQLATEYPEDRSQFLEKAREAVLQGLRHIDNLRGRSKTNASQMAWSKQRSYFYSCLLWLESRLGLPLRAQWETARRAKSEELLRHLTRAKLAEHFREDEGSFYRRIAMMYEADLIRKNARITPDRDVGEELRDVNLAYEEYEQVLIESELSRFDSKTNEDKSASTGMFTLTLPSPDTVVCDLTVSPWGTVVLWAGRGLPEDGASVTLPFNLKALYNLLVGQEEETGWFVAYGKRRTARQKWHDSTNRLLDALRVQIWEPCLDQLSLTIDGASLYIIPGSFYSLPIHACSPKGKAIVDSVASLAFVPRLELICETTVPVILKDALCILSDPDEPGYDLLKAAPREIQRIATELSHAGMNVTVVASSGPLSGKAVFESRNLSLPGSITVIPHRPTPEWVQENLHNYDLLVYSGHGSTGGSEEAKLLLVDSAGRTKLLRLLDILSAPLLVRAPIVLLSACETAMEESTGFDEQSSVASALLRIGARYVVGTLWVAEDDTAAKFSEKFCAELIGGVEPEKAFIRAVQCLDRTKPTSWATFCLWHANSSSPATLS